MAAPLRLERWGEGVSVLVIDRPDRRNVLDDELLAAIADTIRQEAQSAGAMVLRGAGGEAFSAGFDLDLINGSMADLDADQSIGRAVDAIIECPVPIISMIQGHCHGAGVELALSCDLRIASDDLKLSLQAVSLGAVYRFEFISRLNQLAGLARAADLLLARPTLTAIQALMWGLVTEVVTAEEIEEQTRKLATAIASSPRTAVKGTKAALALIARRAVDADDLMKVKQLSREAIVSPERRAALSAMKKRLGRN